MNEEEIKEINRIKPMAKIMAKQWIFNNFNNMYKPTNNKTYNDNCIIALKAFHNQFIHMIPNLTIAQIYMFNYTTKMMIDIIDRHSERVSKCSLAEKQKSCGI
jgi:hypothetical protein